ncbi:hypothetical protein ABB34_11630 [Stenotrophomonas daejeonensis]|uniref:Lipoprotein n=1 Tax=Stenotrophomonas daejeonensis TaxID=659018 RepID=A0A0R0DQ78_9GAMM|nr:hypothetical protein [Stenotrophomonas daejeonensis]KRG83557.1 hypothetical protein ABB34_11630 [Stenotrophomonas daejeonensis]
MKKTSFGNVLLVAAIGAVALVGCKKQEPAPAPAPEASMPAPVNEPAPAASALSVTSVSVGNAAAADKTVAPLATLGAKDKIIVSVKTDGTASNATVAARLTYQDGQVAGEQNAMLNTEGAETTNLEFSNTNDWPTGKYRAEVTLDGQPAGMAQEFEVK